MKMKRVLALIMSTVLVCGSLAGCGSAKKEEATKDADGKVTISFMTWESQEMNSKMLASFDKFMKENPDIKVELVPSPLEDYGTKLNQMISAGEAPDIFMLGDSDERSKGATGVLYDYTDLIKGDTGFKDSFYPGIIDSWNVGGKYYGLPGLINLTGILYNKQMFKAAGITPNPNWTFEEMYQASEKLMDKSKNMYGMYNMPITPFDFGLYSATNGSDGFTKTIVDPTEVVATDKFKEGISLYQQYLNKGAVMPPDYDTKNITTMFMDGKVPMMWYGQWAADELIRNAPKDFEWGFLPNPAVNQNKYKTMTGCVGWSSPAKIKHPKETYKVLKYMLTQTYKEILPQTPVAPAANKEAAKPYFDALVAAGHEDMKTGLEKMLNADKVASSFAGAKWSGKAEKIWKESWNSILKGDKDMSEIDTIVKNIDDVIK